MAEHHDMYGHVRQDFSALLAGCSCFFLAIVFLSMATCINLQENSGEAICYHLPERAEETNVFWKSRRVTTRHGQNSFRLKFRRLYAVGVLEEMGVCWTVLRVLEQSASLPPLR